MGIDPWVDKGTFPPTFWSGGDALYFVPSTFSGVDIFVLMHTVTGAIFVKFNQLILTKIIKIVATRCQILWLKCT